MATMISSSVKPRPPGAGHEVYPYAVKQMPLVRGGSSSDPGATGTTAAAGSEHSVLLELTVGTRDGADSDPQVAGELA